ncbi:hypothetical protein NXH76_03190 [Blautia schinkii]|nr:hypothetical protein [Blautia schinkii]
METDVAKLYGNWSAPAKIAVKAVTPQQPRITDIKVKGSIVTATYKVCENATGYDVVLGSQVKSVHGENRPVSYGTYVAKAKRGNTVTVTFKNVKKGTYYAGLHAYNRTSTNKGKVFSKWSPAKKVVVK